MRLVSFSRSSSSIHTGVVVEGGIVDLTLAGLPGEVTELIRLGPGGLEAARDAAGSSEPIAFDQVRIHAPVPRPPKNVMCVGRNYLEHAAEFSRSRFDASIHPGSCRRATRSRCRWTASARSAIR